MWPMTVCQALISIISFNSLKELDGGVIGEAANWVLRPKKHLKSLGFPNWIICLSLSRRHRLISNQKITENSQKALLFSNTNCILSYFANYSIERHIKSY